MKLCRPYRQDARAAKVPAVCICRKRSLVRRYSPPLRVIACFVCVRLAVLVAHKVNRLSNFVTSCLYCVLAVCVLHRRLYKEAYRPAHGSSRLLCGYLVSNSFGFVHASI